MYKLSRDYIALFNLLCDENTALGFVKAPDWCGANARKDPVMIYRNAPYDIFMGVRGTGYGSVYPYQQDDGDEGALFAGSCRLNDLEWVEPNVELRGAPQKE